MRKAGWEAHLPLEEFPFQTSVSACLLLPCVLLAETQNMTLEMAPKSGTEGSRTVLVALESSTLMGSHEARNPQARL